MAYSYEGEIATVAGWGHDLDFSKINPHLRPIYEVNVTIYGYGFCSKTKRLKLDEIGEFCAGKGGKSDSCSGDSGGPLMIKENGR